MLAESIAWIPKVPLPSKVWVSSNNDHTVFIVDTLRKFYWELSACGPLLPWLGSPWVANNVRVFNLARSYRYQRTGYYVSLLAAARGHRPMPDVEAIQDLKSRTVLRLASEDLLDLVQRSLHPIQSDHFVLSAYFGRNLPKRHDRLAAALCQ